VDAKKKARLTRVLERIGKGFVQDIPPELEACEICRKTECTQDEWIACGNRIAHAKCLEEIQSKKQS